PPAARRRSCLLPPSGFLYDHDRNLAGGPLLVFLVRRPDRGHLLPQRRLLGLGGGAGARLEALGHHLHLDLGLRGQVLVPGRVLGRAAAGGHHHVAVAVAAVDQRGRAGLAGAPAGRRQQEGRHALPDVAVLATGLEVTLGVFLLPAG